MFKRIMDRINVRYHFYEKQLLTMIANKWPENEVLDYINWCETRKFDWSYSDTVEGEFNHNFLTAAYRFGACKYSEAVVKKLLQHGVNIFQRVPHSGVSVFHCAFIYPDSHFKLLFENQNFSLAGFEEATKKHKGEFLTTCFSKERSIPLENLELVLSKEPTVFGDTAEVFENVFVNMQNTWKDVFVNYDDKIKTYHLLLDKVTEAARNIAQEGYSDPKQAEQKSQKMLADVTKVCQSSVAYCLSHPAPHLEVAHAVLKDAFLPRYKDQRENTFLHIMMSHLNGFNLDRPLVSEVFDMVVEDYQRNEKNISGLTPLISWAAAIRKAYASNPLTEVKNMELVKRVMQSGKIDVNEQDNDGNTALNYLLDSVYLSAEKETMNDSLGLFKAIKFLTEERGAHWDIPNKLGATPRDIAESLRPYLLKHGIQVPVNPRAPVCIAKSSELSIAKKVQERGPRQN